MAYTPKTKLGYNEQSALSEAAHLLSNMEIGYGYSDWASGEQVAVSANTLINDDGTLRLSVNCLALGQQRVSWQGMPIHVTSTAKDSRPPTYLRRLDARGSCIIPQLADDNYQLSAWSCYGRSKELPVFSPPASSLQPVRGVRSQLAAAPPSGESTQRKVFPSQTIISNDGRIQATLRQTRANELSVEFRTEDPDLEGATITCALVQRDGTVKKTGTVTLKPRPDQLSVFRGLWKESMTLAECELVFNVQSASDARNLASEDDTPSDQD